jgi:hypothetical protein
MSKKGFGVHLELGLTHNSNSGPDCKSNCSQKSTTPTNPHIISSFPCTKLIEITVPYSNLNRYTSITSQTNNEHFEPRLKGKCKLDWEPKSGKKFHPQKLISFGATFHQFVKQNFTI